MTIDTPLRWESFHDDALTLMKNKLSQRTMLHYLSPDGTLTLTTDATDKAIGGVLHDNRTDGTNVPLALFSRKLSVAERNYSVFDKELLAILPQHRNFDGLLKVVTVSFLPTTNPLLRPSEKQPTTPLDNPGSFRSCRKLLTTLFTSLDSSFTGRFNQS